jgi:tetratricopeptide (TPR) repeat protein
MLGCLDEQVVVDLVAGHLDPEVEAAALSHIDACGPCRKLVAEAAHSLRSATEGARPAAFEPVLLSPGTKVGRYLILELAGRGAMGVVYSAYDPELDRKVALKLLRTDRSSDTESLRNRFLREGQALARLSHPNVVPVHDAGTFAEGVFVAMDFVEGGTVRDWLAECRRSWREILRVFALAGQGLAAAHRAGLIHRDFKPENVLCDREGRVCVTDFGLARSITAPAPGPAPAPAAVEESPLGLRLTRTGTLLGTPAYMAPEQFRGHGSTPSADQFNFCVAFYEALYGERPFAGAGFVALRASVLAGSVRDEPRDARVPAWLRRVLVRGLRPRPEDRYPSMESLLRALGQDPALSRRRWLLAAGIATAIAVAALFTLRAVREPASLCEPTGTELAGAWDPARKQEIEATFRSTRTPAAESAWQAVEGVLDRYAEEWVATRAEACRATRLGGHQSEEMLDRRMQCLEQHRRQLAALTELFARADAQVVFRAIGAAQTLPRHSECSAAAQLKSRLRPPPDERTRAEVDRLRGELAKGQALHQTGKYAEAVRLTEKTAREARALAYPPIEAEALDLLAYSQAFAGSFAAAEGNWHEAVRAAAVGGHDLVAASALVRLVYIVGARGKRFDEALNLARHASAAVDRVDTDGELRSGLLRHLGIIHEHRGDYAVAARYHEQALEHSAKAFGPGNPRLSQYVASLGRVYRALSRYEDAKSAYRLAIPLQERATGRDHPSMAHLLGNLGNVYRNLGEYEESVRLGRAALDIREKTLGPAHHLTVFALMNVAEALSGLGRSSEARALLERAIVAAEKLPASLEVLPIALTSLAGVRNAEGEHSLAMALLRRALALWGARGSYEGKRSEALIDLAMTLVVLGRHREAVAPLREARSLQARTFAGATSALAQAFEVDGLIQQAEGKPHEALAAHRRARDVAEKTVGPKHPLFASALVGIGEANLALGAVAPAREALERALPLLTGRAAFAARIADGRFALARALWRSKEQRSRARQLALEARNDYAREKIPRLGEVVAWLERPR